MKNRLLFLLLLLPTFLFAQNKTLTHNDLASWKQLKNAQISNDGAFVLWEENPEEGDGSLQIYDVARGKRYTQPRGKDAKISADGNFAAFKVVPYTDTIKDMRRKKIEEDKFPKDTLVIYNLRTKNVVKIPKVKSFKMPVEWNGYLAFQREAIEPEPTVADTNEVKKGKPKKEGKKNGTTLSIWELATKKETRLSYVKEYQLAKSAPEMLLHSTGKDSTFEAGIYVFFFEEGELSPLYRGEGEFKQLAIHDAGRKAAFLADLDTTEMQVRPFQLRLWAPENGLDSAYQITNLDSEFLPKDWRVSENGRLSFSKNGEKLYFGTAPQPILQDTSILDEEIVNVEVWHWQDERLYPQQNNNLKTDKNQTYRAIYFLQNKKFTQVENKDLSEIFMANEGNANTTIAFNQKPYSRQASWEGFPMRKDVYKVDEWTGKREQIGKNVMASPRLSPQAKYMYWYSHPDSAWFATSMRTNTTKQLTTNTLGIFYDKHNDRPMYPYPNGIAGWTNDDETILIYDQNDIWAASPDGLTRPKRLTHGKEQKLRFRYIRLDRDERNIDPNKPILMHIFDENTKGSGYALLDIQTGKLTSLILDNQHSYTRRVLKAKNADKYVFTKQNFQTFPDLLLSDANFKKPKQISLANPQQKDYNWGNIELFEWTATDGQKIEGLLIKPANFDPKKKYPMLVNFYERSSDGLLQHRAPYPHRSTINYAFYASKGYVIFNPDVPYTVGYPGKSAENAVISGVEAVLEMGFVDAKKIGVQGHSWGGYQVAHLVTKTDIFACAESGAPVVNMVSAYGGIRWGSGLSRMFQYEHTQSRIGGTLWDKRDLYLENSPIFNVDKINTPVLILHNDKDGAVPWYQGIEWFVAMRRLNKPAWMLNYNDEPHWPVKLQNRRDFNVRMQQFFDHYLMAAPAPSWMERGVPAVEKGILQGLE